MTQERATDWTGRVLRVRVEGPAQGGEFVARHEGRVVFCRGAVTGELVDVVVDDDPGRAFCRATVTEVIQASPHRVDPQCPAAAAGAGCCDWSHITPDAARGFAGRIIAEQAARIGRIELADGEIPVEVPAGDDATTGWRTVARWVTDGEGKPGVRRARSRDLITEPCVQPDPRILQAVLAADIGAGREVLGVLDDDGTAHIAHRAADSRGPGGRGRRSRQSAATRARARHSRAGAWQTVTGESAVLRRVAGHQWQLPIEAFWQAHRSAAGHYADRVRTAVSAAPATSADPVVWDLYGGAGLFTSAVLDVLPSATVTIVESSSSSLRAAATALGDETGVRAVRSRVESFLDTPADADGGSTDPDIVILDPPRGGAGIAVMEQLASRVGTRIVHVGCDPASLARDVGVLVTAGWGLTSLGGVASFPGTHHIEGIAVLDAPDGA